MPDEYCGVLLTEKGKINYRKLIENNQLTKGLNEKRCSVCDEPMDWRVGDSITLRDGNYGYRTYHLGECLKVGQNAKVIFSSQKISILFFALAMKGGEFLHNLMLYLLFYFDTYL